MLTLHQSRAAGSGADRLVVAPRPRSEGLDRDASAEVDVPAAVCVPSGTADLAERLDELLADATDPECWEAVVAGCARHAGDPDLPRAVAPLVGAARENYGRGVGGVWYLDPEHDAARLVLVMAGRPVARRAPSWGWADHRRRRVDEVLDVLAAGRPATPLATPTRSTGAVAPGALAERLGRGAGLGTADRTQARLRARGRPPVGQAWQVQAEGGPQGVTIRLTEIVSGGRVISLPDTGDPAGSDDTAGSWAGIAGESGSQRVPTREADLLRWASPHEADRLDAWAAERLARNIDWWEADWDERRLFTRLRMTHQPPGLPGRVLLAVGLATKQPSAHQPAVAVTRRLLEAGLLGPAQFGGTVAALAGALDPRRLASTLDAVRQTHAGAVAAVLDGCLTAFDRTDRRVTDLIHLYADVSETTGGAPASDALVAWLGSVPGSGSLRAAASRALAALRG